MANLMLFHSSKIFMSQMSCKDINTDRVNDRNIFAVKITEGTEYCIGLANALMTVG